TVRRDGADASPPDWLTVKVDGDRDVPDRVIMISRPVAGRVHLVEWTSADWTASADRRESSVSAVYADLERVQQARRRMSEELLRIRIWLDGD
ncbi:MAG: hypothetical protein M3Z10_07920, partial [Gemmatimonadota bacterium]|nr:hypothetical protein [Gemmatimonadota bacterium]